MLAADHPIVLNGLERLFEPESDFQWWRSGPSRDEGGELELVRMIGFGLRNKGIAEALSISEGTVKIHHGAIHAENGDDYLRYELPVSPLVMGVILGPIVLWPVARRLRLGMAGLARSP